jgi:hypothetical protein
LSAVIANISGNITGGNLITSGRVLASGNILGLNFATEGSVQASSVQATGNVSAGLYGQLGYNSDLGAWGLEATEGFYDVSLTAGDATKYTARLNNDGVFYLPETVSANVARLSSEINNADVDLVLVGGKDVRIESDGTSTNKTWTFDADGTLTAPGNITTTGNINGVGATFSGNVTAENFTGNINITGNVTGTSANVDLVAGAYEWSFDNTGNLTLPGNTFSVNYANNTPVDVVTRFEDTWTVPVGNSTQSFTVDAANTYQMWVECNIANGIISWNATATITNTNVPVVGAQYAWVYDGAGTPIDFTSIPNQFVGTANTIVRSNVSPSVTTNRFDFGINNTSGSEQTVRYGWIRIS